MKNRLPLSIRRNLAGREFRELRAMIRDLSCILQLKAHSAIINKRSCDCSCENRPMKYMRRTFELFAVQLFYTNREIKEKILYVYAVSGI